MPLNLLKKYADLLDLDFLNENKRLDSLRSIFKRDIEDNDNFCFRKKRIYPVKVDQDAMSVLFSHLINKSEDNFEANGSKYKSRTIYDPQRSKRLHWIKFHIDESKQDDIDIFSVEERINGKNRQRTYIYDIDEKYIVVLEPQKGDAYYLITAHYLQEAWAVKAMNKRKKRKLPEVL